MIRYVSRYVSCIGSMYRRYVSYRIIDTIHKIRRYPLLGFFCHLKTVPLDRDNGTFNSSNTDVVEKVNFLVAADNTGVLRWRKDTHSTWTEMALFWSLFTGGSFLVDFLENEIVGFDENLTVAL